MTHSLTIVILFVTIGTIICPWVDAGKNKDGYVEWIKGWFTEEPEQEWREAIAMLTEKMKSLAEDTPVSSYSEKLLNWVTGTPLKPPPPPEESTDWSCKFYNYVKAGVTGISGAVGASQLGTAAGFTTAGIAKGSLAAMIQAKFGTGVLFSFLQSVGMTGSMTALGPVGIAGGVLGTTGYSVYNYFYGSDCIKVPDSDVCSK